MKHFLYLTLLFVWFSCSTSNSPDSSEVVYPLHPQVYPGAQWATASPAEQRIDSTALKDALGYLATHCKADGLSETMVIRNGLVVWAGDSINKVHDIWSCTKSFTSAAVGLMEEEGILSAHQPVADHEPLLKPLYPAATYRHFLTMTSGYNAEGATRWPTDVSEDWSETPYVPTTPLFAPGTEYTYWDEAMIMLGRALTRASGTTLNDYLDERLFQKIGIRKQRWWGEGEVNGHKINFGGTGLRMSASEQARFGLLLLNGGKWNDQSVLPADYCANAIINQVPANLPLADTDRKSTDGTGRYGFNWWIINKGTDAPVSAAFTSGLNHNVCLIVPEWDMVIVRMGVDGNPEKAKHEVYAEVLKRLAKGVK